MPIAEIAAQDVLNLAALMSLDLAAELRRQQVSEPLLATLTKAGFRTVRKFHMIAHPPTLSKTSKKSQVCSALTGK